MPPTGVLMGVRQSDIHDGRIAERPCSPAQHYLILCNSPEESGRPFYVRSRVPVAASFSCGALVFIQFCGHLLALTADEAKVFASGADIREIKIILADGLSSPFKIKS
ncbi:hypothetical protein SCB29_22385 [Paraburkholderia sp. SIMBA_055]